MNSKIKTDFNPSSHSVFKHVVKTALTGSLLGCRKRLILAPKLGHEDRVQRQPSTLLTLTEYHRCSTR